MYLYSTTSTYLFFDWPCTSTVTGIEDLNKNPWSSSPSFMPPLTTILMHFYDPLSKMQSLQLWLEDWGHMELVLDPRMVPSNGEAWLGRLGGERFMMDTIINKAMYPSPSFFNVLSYDSNKKIRSCHRIFNISLVGRNIKGYTPI